MSLLSRLFVRRSRRDLADSLARTVDRLRGLDFIPVIKPEAVGLDPKLASHSAPSGDRWLRRLLRSLPITTTDRVLDVGCGKGSAMRVLLEFPFERVEGIEIAPSIAAIARSNFERLRVPQGRLRIHVADAREFDGLEQFSHVYMYNPFPSQIMVPFLLRLRASLERHPRAVTLIYNHPLCHADVMATGKFEKILEAPADWGHKILVYRA